MVWQRKKICLRGEVNRRKIFQSFFRSNVHESLVPAVRYKSELGSPVSTPGNGDHLLHCILQPNTIPWLLPNSCLYLRLAAGLLYKIRFIDLF